MKNVALITLLVAGYLFRPVQTSHKIKSNKLNSSPLEIKLNDNLIAFPRIQINDTGQEAPMIIVLHGRNSSELFLQKYILETIPARIFFMRGQIPTDLGNLFYLNRLRDDPTIVGPQIKQAGKILDKAIKTLLEKYPTNKLIIMGFSQGAGLALYMGSIGKADSIIALSGSLPTILYPTQVYDTEIFMWHGKKDKTVPFELTNETYKDLYNKGFNVEFQIGENNYHSLPPQDVINSFLNKAL